MSSNISSASAVLILSVIAASVVVSEKTKYSRQASIIVDTLNTDLLSQSTSGLMGELTAGIVKDTDKSEEEKKAAEMWCSKEKLNEDMLTPDSSAVMLDGKKIKCRHYTFKE